MPVPTAPTLDIVDRTTSCAVLRLRRVVPGHDDDTRRAGKALLDVMRRVDELAVVSFRVRAVDNELHAGFVIESFDAESAKDAAQRLSIAVSSLAPWLDFAVASFDESDVLALPAQPIWASRVRRTEMEDELIRAGNFSPLAIALTKTDALLSVSIAQGPDAGAGLATDVILTSDQAPTDLLGALLTAELVETSHLEIESGHREGAARIVASHGRPEQPLEAAVFADVFSIPGRAREATAWSRQPAVAKAASEALGALASAPHLHRWVVGRTGMGKTTLLENLVAADIAAGKTIVVLDPHGDLADRVAATARARGGADAARLAFADLGSARPLTINPLQPEPGQSISSLVDELVESMRSLWDDMSPDFFGPVWNRIMRIAIEAVVRYAPRPTFATLVALLTGDVDVFGQLVSAAEADGNGRLASALRTDLEGMGRPSSDGAQVSVSLWAVSKLQSFTDDERMRAIVEARDPDIILEEIVASQRILVVRAPVGVLGMTAVRALTQTILTRLTGVLGRRFEDRATDRPPVSLYIDEWALVTERPVQRILAEGRKYGFELTIAGQSTRQVRDPLQVAANVGTLALFRLGPAEANLFEPELAGFSAAGLRSLPPHHVVVRTPDGHEVYGQTPSPAGSGVCTPDSAHHDSEGR